jgi:dsDNA-specific endonuclease/ATPase MutS2
MSRAKLRIHLEDPVELSSPREINRAITEALEEERKIILEEFTAQAWSEVQAILQGVAKQRFFDRVIAKLPSTLRGKAAWAFSLKTNIREYHAKYENLEKFLIQLNHFLGSQDNLRYFRNLNSYSYDLPQTTPGRSAFYNFLTDLC